MSRPVPNPGILEIAPYTPGKSPVRRARPQGVQAVGQRDPARALAEGHRGLQAAPPTIWRTIRKAPRACCAKRSAAPSGSIPTASSAAPAPTKSSICWRTPISATATRRSPPPTASWCIRSRPWRTAPSTWSRPKPISPPTSMRSSRGSRRAPSWCGSPTRTTRPEPTCRSTRSSGCAPDCRGHVLLVLDAAYSDYVSRNDYETRHRTGGDHREHRDDATPSPRFTASPPCGSAGCSARPISSTRSTAFAGRSTSRRRRCWRRWRRSRTPRMSRCRRRTPSKWRNWLTEEMTKLGLKVTPSVANFVLIHFPQDKGKTAADADAFLTRRGLVLRGLDNYGLPHALRMTIGTEEANRLVVDGLRDFMAAQVSAAPHLQQDRADRLRADRRLDRARRARAGAGGRNRHHRALGEDPRAGARNSASSTAWSRPTPKPSRTPTSSSSASRSAPAARSRRRSRPHLKPGAIVSDVGSVKGAIVRDMAPHLPDGVHFVPAHPVAGTEHSGPDSGFAELFINRWCILTPPEGVDPDGGRDAARVLGGARRQGRDHDAGSSRPRARDHQPSAASDRLHHRRHRRRTGAGDLARK